MKQGRAPVSSILLLGLLWSGCKAPPDAPTELDALTTYLFRNWEAQEAGALERGMFNLQALFAQMELDVGYGDRSYQIESLTSDDLAGATHPEGADPAVCLGLGLVAGSAFTPEQNSQVIILADQTPVEPFAPDRYDRLFLEPSDPSCFPGRDCPLLRTNNEITKKNSMMEIPYEMIKDYRWVELAEDGLPGSGVWGILGRTWMEERGVGVSGNNTIEQSYSIDVFLPGAHGGWEAYRYLGLWNETTGAVEDPEAVMALSLFGMDGMFDETEAWLEDNL
jgi:hypothetical protein